ncbi:MAG: nucleotide pyrophosphohydrolase [Nanoarchaeota archaeon]|nr:nucleotide pyrophosphohydrolase [Nanoarchaeota archaeon]
MSFKEMQEDAEKWTSQFTPQYFPRTGILAQMSEELGEIAREINHLEGVKKKKEGEKGELGQELVDLTFAIVCMANSHGINLDDEWNRMMEERHYKRDQNRFLKKE